jgi:hypothetical protein
MEKKKGKYRDENGSTELDRCSRRVEEPGKTPAHVIKGIFTIFVREFNLTCVTVRNDIYNTVRHLLRKKECSGTV